MLVVHTEDLTARGFYEDYIATDYADAVTEARARWDHFTCEEMMDRKVTVYHLSTEDYRLIQEGEGTYDDYAFEVIVYSIEGAEE